MAIITRKVCKCGVCGHQWIPEKPLEDGLPRRCPSRKCRTTMWNGISQYRPTNKDLKEWLRNKEKEVGDYVRFRPTRGYLTDQL